MRGGRSECTVGKPLPPNNTHPPPRCARMRAAPARAWHGFPPIVAAHWDGCTRAQPRAQPSSSAGLVAKRLAWGHPDTRGDLAYRGLQGGQGQQRVAMRGTSAWCVRCATVSVDHWGSPGSPRLHAGVSSRHRLRTVPALCRPTCSHNAAVGLRAVRRGGVRGMADCESAGRGNALQGGAIGGRHPPGRHGPSHPPRPRIAPRGGVAGQGPRWEPLHSVPYELLRHTWQGDRLRRGRQTRTTEAVNRVGDGWGTQAPHGGVTPVQQGTVPAGDHSVARDVAQDGVRPPRAGRRLARSDGARGTYQSRSPRPERGERDTVEVATCMGRMGPHTVPQGCQRIRYEGVQATTTLAQVQGRMQEAWATVEGVVTGALKLMARLPSRPRYAQRTGRDPWRGPPCRSAMGGWRLWHPTYGVSDDEGQVINRGT
jgi:hypothetical protein